MSVFKNPAKTQTRSSVRLLVLGCRAAGSVFMSTQALYIRITASNGFWLYVKAAELLTA